MVFFELDYLCELVKEAVEFSNKSAKEIVFDPALIKENIAQDVMALTACAACADGAFTKEELDKTNKLMAEFGYELPEEYCDEVLGYIKTARFEPPKTLVVLKFRAEEYVRSMSAIAPAATAFESLKIGRVILAYANIMRYIAIENGFVPQEKQGIIQFIENCIAYVESSLGQGFRKYCNYMPILSQKNFTPLYAAFDGEILSMNAAEGDTVTYNSLLGILVAAHGSCNVLSPAHGTIHKLKVKTGDHVKKGDLLAIIAIS